LRQGRKRSTKRPAGKAKKSASRSSESLKRKLAAERKQLRAVLAEQQSAQEEERRLTNEELENASEELRSTNDQLNKLNAELQQRNGELRVLANDLNNLLEGVDIPVLVLDGDWHVRRFTQGAGSLLNLMPGDVGRPFRDIASALSPSDWEGLFCEVRHSGRLVEREVRDRRGRHYALRLRPYKTDANEIDGVLVVLFDIDAMQCALEQATEARDCAQDAERLNDSILNSMTANVAVLSAGGVIVKTNEAWNRFARENGTHR
jgi:two-component system CheB/CheR fusion protein